MTSITIHIASDIYKRHEHIRIYIYYLFVSEARNLITQKGILPPLKVLDCTAVSSISIIDNFSNYDIIETTTKKKRIKTPK